MKSQVLSDSFVLAISSLPFILAGGKEYPKWPWDFKFSLYGPVSGHHCVELSELVPLYYFWFDNHFCVRNESNFKNIGMLWTAMGKLHIFFKKVNALKAKISYILNYLSVKQKHFFHTLSLYDQRSANFFDDTKVMGHQNSQKLFEIR